MWFAPVALAFMTMGRRAGWSLSKALLYPAPLALSLAGAVIWGVAVGIGMSYLIGWFQPAVLLKWIMGFWLGAYVAVPNFGLFAESTIPDSARPRHLIVGNVPLFAYIATELSTGALRSSNRGRDLSHFDKAGHFLQGAGATLIFILMLCVSLFLLHLSLGWISNRHPRLRNLVACLVAAVSTYAAGFAIDMCVSAAAGVIPKENVVSPVITWTIIALGCYVLASETATTNRVIFIPYLINGGLATVGAVVGHVRNVFVALALLGIAVAIYKAPGKKVRKSYYEYDEATKSFRAMG